MPLSNLDGILIILVIAGVLIVGIAVGRRSAESAESYFLSGRNMPWWLLGISMVATTFSTDTPNLVTDLVRTEGVAGNWLWWAFLFTGLLTVFVYARLWKKTGVSTDMEFYELRYGGKPARFLRIFRSFYLGVLFNILAMAGVMLAAIKMGQIMLDLQPWVTVCVAGGITAVFSVWGGFRGVVYTDLFLFVLAMTGSLAACVYIVNLPDVGGLSALWDNPVVREKRSLFPESDDMESWIKLLIIPLAVQWWSAWYPGAEPGGGGYVAQRMLAARDSNHAIGATFFFNVMHYALRPWPWILVALASLAVYPDLASLKEAFPAITDDKLGHDMAYPAMLTRLPSGLLGLVLASLTAAFMSTLSTHLNWGASYVVNDVFLPVFGPGVSERRKVWVGRLSTFLLVVCAGLVALTLQTATELFEIILMFGAGTGLLFLLRWFWRRINAWSEITAMTVSGVLSLTIKYGALGNLLFSEENGLLPSWSTFPFIVLVTTVAWIIVTLFTPPERDSVLKRFTEVTELDLSAAGSSGDKYPGIPGRRRAIALTLVSGLLFVYGSLFATGLWIYGSYGRAVILTLVSLGSGYLLKRSWDRLDMDFSSGED